MILEGVNKQEFLEELEQFYYQEILRLREDRELMKAYHYEPKHAFADEWPEIYFVLTGKRKKRIEEED